MGKRREKGWNRRNHGAFSQSSRSRTPEGPAANHRQTSAQTNQATQTASSREQDRRSAGALEAASRFCRRHAQGRGALYTRAVTANIEVLTSTCSLAVETYFCETALTRIFCSAEVSTFLGVLSDLGVRPSWDSSRKGRDGRKGFDRATPRVPPI